MTDARLLRAQGERVEVSIAGYADVDVYRAAMLRSKERIGRWNPVNPDDLVHHLSAQSEKHRTFLIRDRSDELRGPGGLVGCVNVSNVVYGRFRSATMGYNAFDGYAGTGMFAEGLRLVVEVAFREPPQGMGLHRVEANVRPGNARSAGVLRSIGFRRERTVRRMLWLADGADGPSAWRDHDSYAVTVEDWPAHAYTPSQQPRGVLVTNASVPDADVISVAAELGATPLVGLTFEAAARIATASGAPIVWAAGEHAADAVHLMRGQRRASSDVSERIRGASASTKHAVAAALAVRDLLG